MADWTKLDARVFNIAADLETTKLLLGSLVMHWIRHESYVCSRSERLCSLNTTDPELYCFQQSIRAIRDYSYTAATLPWRTFLAPAHHSLKPTQIHVTACTFAIKLMQVGRQVAAEGNICTDTMLALHSLQLPLQSLLRCSQHRWMKNMFYMFLGRPEWRKLPIPTIHRETPRYLPSRGCPPISRFLFQGFHRALTWKPNKRNGYWKDRRSTRVAFKKMTRWSIGGRLQHCQMTKYITLEIPAVVEFLDLQNSCHLHLPVVQADDLLCAFLCDGGGESRPRPSDARPIPD